MSGLTTMTYILRKTNDICGTETFPKLLPISRYGLIVCTKPITPLAQKVLCYLLITFDGSDCQQLLF